ncbi:10503_t:CDS:1 [Paraglomus occultum]|uniref:10503_t:CDS:1 n=1 Tax=Paraglomus occultum TaxID=144539 RepID=A0A9N9GVI6_9GLOM|nr:10503_t:CDS:1 [Paraglomus occultum]
MVGVSATHIKGGLPISRKLNGPIYDRYVTDFKSLLKEFPDFFKPVVLVFCDDMSLINLTPFKQKLSAYGIRHKILDVTSKKEATEIVQTFASFGGDSPKLIFLDNAYEAGINFRVSPLNILATGVGSMEITLDENGNKKTVIGDCTIGSYTQQRGRTSRNSNDPPSVFAALSTVFGN